MYVINEPSMIATSTSPWREEQEETLAKSRKDL